MFAAAGLSVSFRGWAVEGLQVGVAKMKCREIQTRIARELQARELTCEVIGALAFGGGDRVMQRGGV